ncbi:MAG TPA: penicillin-binding protein activator [Stellaceae bacterium]|nr:penicillin-binding protein activator [Stellaceae bacterium]
MSPAPVGKPQPPYSGSPVSATAPPSPAPAPGSEAIKIAVLLPLSGANADLGKAMLEAAQLALFTMGDNKLTLVPRDTTGTVQGAADAAKAVIADGAKLIIGPLVADEVEAVKSIAAAANVNVIAFATKTQVAGGNVFLMGFLPRQEVAREVSFAHERGVTRFAALAPNTAYGHLMADSLKEIVASSGATVVRVEFFAGDPSAVIKKMAPANGATPNFDALLLPEGGDQLKQIAQQLKAAGIDSAQVHLLGSGLWDDPGIESEPTLAGGWFAASPPDTRQFFVSRYQGAYGHAPPRLASLAFDAAALAAVLAKSPDPDPFSQAAIETPNGFTGVDGLFRFTQQGLVQRGLAVLEVQPGNDTVVSPAPKNFQDFAY